MYSCKSCLHRNSSLWSYVRHYLMHSNEANITFPCAFDTCKRAFRTYSAFKSHVFRDHVNDSNKRKLSVGEASGILHCPLGFCGRHIESLQDLIKHLNDHIMQGNEIICLFKAVE